MNEHLPKKLAQDGWTSRQKLASGGQSIVLEIKGVDGVRALKIIKEGASSTARERFLREVHVLKKLDHPNVIKILDSDCESERPWYTMEVHKNFSTWWKTLRRKESPDRLVAKSVEIIKALSSALRALHSEGYIHRDIKDGNILWSRNGPVLCDFGLAFVRLGHRLSPLDPINKKQSQIVHRYDTDYEYRSSDDCFDLMALWSWMLAKREDLQFDYYHWQHFRLLEAENIDRVRSIWAVCSDQVLAPTSGQELCELLDSIFPAKQSQGGILPVDFSLQANRAAAAKAHSMLEEGRRREHIRAFLQSYEPFLNSFEHGLDVISRNLRLQMGNVFEFFTPHIPGESTSYFLNEFERIGSKINEGKTLDRHPLEFRTDVSKLGKGLSLSIFVFIDWSGERCVLRIHKCGAALKLESGITKQFGLFNQMFISPRPGEIVLDPHRESQNPKSSNVKSFDDLVLDIENLIQKLLLPEDQNAALRELGIE